MNIQKYNQPGYAWMLILMAFILVALPFIGIQSLPFTDHPNHLARFHVLENFEHSPELQALYTMKGGFQPYWGMKSFMALISPLFGVEAAGRLFSITAIFMPVAGTIAINKAVTGRVHLILFVAIIFAFSEVAGWGFLNFLFSIGIAMMIFAFWIKTENWRWGRRVPVFAGLAFILTCLHMISVGFLGLFIGLWELSRIVLSRHLEKSDVMAFIMIALTFLPSGIFILMQSASDFGETETYYGSVYERIEATLSPFGFLGSSYSSYNWHFIPVFVLLIAYFIHREKSRTSTPPRPGLSFEPRLLFISVSMLVLSFFVPFVFSGVAYINIRFPVVSVMFAVASIRFSAKAITPSMIGVLSAAIIVKLTLVTAQLHHFDREISELRRAATIIPKGSKAMLAYSGEQPNNLGSPHLIIPRNYNHVLGYLVLDRDILFPYFFSMFEVGIKPEHAEYTRPHEFAVSVRYMDTPDIRDYAKNWRQDYDYVIQFHYGPTEIPEIPDTVILHEGSWFRYLRPVKSSD